MVFLTAMPPYFFTKVMMGDGALVSTFSSVGGNSGSPICLSREFTASSIISAMKAKKGTPINIPGIPQSPPITVIATIIPKELKPRLEPSMNGATIFPSICCIIMIRMMNRMTFPGSTMKMINALGTAPRNGPRIGIILVNMNHQAIYVIFETDTIRIWMKLLLMTV